MRWNTQKFLYTISLECDIQVFKAYDDYQHHTPIPAECRLGNRRILMQIRENEKSYGGIHWFSGTAIAIVW